MHRVRLIHGCCLRATKFWSNVLWSNAQSDFGILTIEAIILSFFCFPNQSHGLILNRVRLKTKYCIVSSHKAFYNLFGHLSRHLQTIVLGSHCSILNKIMWETSEAVSILKSRCCYLWSSFYIGIWLHQKRNLSMLLHILNCQGDFLHEILHSHPPSSSLRCKLNTLGVLSL